MAVKTEKGTELPLLNLKGKEYLQVQHRLLWFREKYPNWTILTDYIAHNDEFALAKATILNEEGRIMATAHKREDESDFMDYHEKAETGAIGRALALVGCGTQFAMELDEETAIVDAPVIPRVKKGLRLEKGEKRPEETVSLAPVCCDRAMIVSKFDEDLWYCLKCKRKQSRQPQLSN